MSTTTQIHILVAEDNEINQIMIRAALEGAGCSVDVVGNGAEALAAARDNRFDAILMDIYMPVMDGDVAAAQIRKLEAPRNAVPIIALSASDSEKEREKCKAAGISEFLSKPINAAQLITTLSKVLSV